jgi:hypothetical protein
LRKSGYTDIKFIPPPTRKGRRTPDLEAKEQKTPQGRDWDAYALPAGETVPR